MSFHSQSNIDSFTFVGSHSGSASSLGDRGYRYPSFTLRRYLTGKPKAVDRYLRNSHNTLSSNYDHAADE